MNDGLVLALDTATAPGGVAVGRNGALLGEVVLETAPRHSELVLPAIEEALRSAGAALRDVGAVVVGAGPGSFTGVRIAAAIAKGLVHARAVPLHAFSSLLAAAVSAGIRDRAVCALFDARRGEAYAGCWRQQEGVMETLLEPTADHVEAIVDRLAVHTPLYIGDGAQRNRAFIEGRGGRVGAPHAGAHCARALIALHHDADGAALVLDPAHWQPSYVRAPNVTMPS